MGFYLHTVVFIFNPLLIHPYFGLCSTYSGFCSNLFNFTVLNRPQLVKLEIYSTSTTITWFPKDHAL